MKKIILIAILILAFILRFYQLNNYPALNADEAAIGYNAYSLLQTGKDEHGNPWPIHFQSFNDYKPGLYVYMVMPFVAVMGLNEWAVRIPGAMLGVLTVLIVFYIVRLIQRHPELVSGSASMWERQIPDQVRHDRLFDLFPLLTGFLLAISPWHIHFSRGGWEVNVATFFITTGLLFFLKFINCRHKLPNHPKEQPYRHPGLDPGSASMFLVLSALSFIASLYTYHAARIIVPLLLLGLSAIYFKSIKTNLKSFVLAGLLGTLLLLPLAIDLLGPAGISRVAGVGLLSDPGPVNRINELRGEHVDYQSSSAVLLHNRVVNYGLAFLDNWTEHYNGNFLFLSGDDIQRNKVPGFGQTYLISILFFAIGIYGIFKLINNKQKTINKEGRILKHRPEAHQPLDEVQDDEVVRPDVRHAEFSSASASSNGWKLILWWFAIAPVAAALTFQSPHALRAQNMVIPFEIINAIGFYTIIIWTTHLIKSRSLLTTSYLLLISLIFVGFTHYLTMYYSQMSKQYPFSSQYGVKELVQYVSVNENKYDNIVITDRYDQPYILFLFYMKYPPAKFQMEHTLSPKDQFGFSTVRSFDKYSFLPIDFEAVKRDYPNSLIVGTDEEITNNANILERVYGSNGYLYFEVVVN